MNETEFDQSPAADRRYGVSIVANDKVIDWLLPFLESYSVTNSSLPLYLIPYDDNMSLTKRAAELYGATIVESEPVEIDRLSYQLYPGIFNANRRRLRKLQALVLPLDEVAYVDVDVILFRDLRPVFGRLERGKVEFIVASPSFDYVYNENRKRHAFLDDALLFNDGFWVTSSRFLTLSDVLATIDSDVEMFHDIRKRGQLFAQPLMNFVVHRRGLKTALLPHCVDNASHENFYKAPGITFRDGKPLDPDGKEIYLAHWAGALSLPSHDIFAGAWKELSKAAWSKFQKRTT
ncbi:hypothetical protein A1351_16395 [Methylosinus sp. R-45379]|jgi:hypothetical protein|uniref:hypothetical protein n=1 Tax=unclassified Methylosinus TaxID=2624500 RepID=UPI00046560B6|nr:MULTISPECIES: hypothetical protein [unclassified Methylosinus]OAI25616.1 hypothetical protein A1351_16395 [Methylosinus sp. R-45379]TDX62506.1 hypothetical protein EDE12_11022 [Methylosinus sp. sav-2]